MTGKIYLEPREEFDTALVNIEENIYGYYEILDVLMGMGMTWEEAREYYEYNIQYLHHYGLAVQYDDEETLDQDDQDQDDQDAFQD